MFQSGAAGPLQQFQHLGGFTALADSVSLRRRGLAGRFDGLFCRGGLLGRLGLGGRNAGLRRGDFGVTLVLRGTDNVRLADATEELMALIRALGGDPQEGLSES